MSQPQASQVLPQVSAGKQVNSFLEYAKGTQCNLFFHVDRLLPSLMVKYQSWLLFFAKNEVKKKMLFLCICINVNGYILSSDHLKMFNF